MGAYLSAEQQAAYRQDGFLVLPDFADAARCLELRERALLLAREHVPSPDAATVFTADGGARHAAERYFLTSGEAIRCFFEMDAFDGEGRLRGEAHLSLNKLGHAMHEQARRTERDLEATMRRGELLGVDAPTGHVDRGVDREAQVRRRRSVRDDRRHRVQRRIFR